MLLTYLAYHTTELIFVLALLTQVWHSEVAAQVVDPQNLVLVFSSK